jgi:hypothetical protein
MHLSDRHIAQRKPDCMTGKQELCAVVIITTGRDGGA